MGIIADALALMKVNQYASAAKLLEDHINDPGLKSSAKIGLMSWIGECYLKVEDRANAAKWYELAARQALRCKELSEYDREKRALLELDQALNYFEAVNDVPGMSRVANLKYSLINDRQLKSDNYVFEPLDKLDSSQKS